MAGACWAEVVGELLKAGADLRALDNEGNAALHYALDESSARRLDDVLKSIRALVSAGADTNQRNKAGLSPRHLAAQRSRSTAIEVEARIEFFGKEDWPAAEARGWKALLAFLDAE
jgi:ankyrin repeat protein